MAFEVEYYVRLAVLAFTVLVELFAIIDALTRPTAAYPAADKLTKPAWLLILVLALAASVVFGSISMIGLIGLIAAGVYLVDVRPALAEITRR